MEIFERMESEVRGYCRSFPAVFATAQGSILKDEDDREYIDFFAGAGTLNYGHNNPALKKRIMDYLERDGLLHGLDMATEAKRKLLEVIEETVLWRWKNKYKIQFTGPTGTNAVEAALKLARKVTGRRDIISFTNGFHGVSLGALAVTGNQHFRKGAGVPLGNATFMPYDGYLGPGVDTVDHLRQLLQDKSSGLGLPAAVIVETVQGEGGVNMASFDWLRRLEGLCREYDILLIVDDIQVGCGRTGTFFSFEKAGILPDIITLSKSLSGYGLPMSLVLLRGEHDVWEPGEHSGTFRGNNLAFISATGAMEEYWKGLDFTFQIEEQGRLINSRLKRMQDRFSAAGEAPFGHRGRGMIHGLAFEKAPSLARNVTKAAFKRGLILETSGSEGQVVKLLPPLTTGNDLLEAGLDILEESVEEALGIDSAKVAGGMV